MAISGETTVVVAANERRTADFHPTVWGDFFMSRVFNTKEQEIEVLKQDVKAMLETPTEKLSEKLNLIDVMERLGIGYHFESEIEEQLQKIYNNGGNVNEIADLSTVALMFRLLRQHGYNVPSDIFNDFKDEEGSFKKELGNDVRGMLSMYEAAYLRKHGETILDEAIEFTTAHLTNLTNLVDEVGQVLGERVTRALKRPLRKGVEKHEQLFFISSYEREEGHDQMLLKLAKLSWNVLQDLYQQELRDITKWWIDLDFATKLSFARDRLIEVYFWGVGAMWEPKFSLSRYLITKITILVSIADDMYDVHGTIDELELFTAAVERWDISMEDLPEYITLFYRALIDFMDEIDSITSEQGRPFCAEYARQAEKNQMRAYLVEARWFAKGEVPTIQEYRRVGVYSCTYPLLSCSTFCAVDALNEFLEDDWRVINEECLQPPSFVSKEVLSMFVGLSKVMEVLYKEFDSYTFSNTTTREMMTALLITPLI
ncbi:Probable terpene synthase 3 [Linum perenne]